MDLRNRTIIRYGAAGVIMNLLLSVAKFIFGYLINSRAILMAGRTPRWQSFGQSWKRSFRILCSASTPVWRCEQRSYTALGEDDAQGCIFHNAKKVSGKSDHNLVSAPAP